MYYYKNGNSYLSSRKSLDLPEISKEEFDAKMVDVESRAQVYAAIYEKNKPLTESEVTHLLIAQQINTLSVDDNTALRMLEFYPEWASGQAYTAGYKVKYGGKLWRCLQAHTSQPGWEPENTPALWEEICETNAGTLDDPIPYDGNMALESGKYYIQGYVIYKCTRDTINPVYNPLAELVGLYVEVAE